MERQEFMTRLDALQAQMQQLRQEYKDSQPVKPKQVVRIGEQLLWLERYKIVGYNVYPILYPLTKSGLPDKHFVEYIQDWHDMKPDVIDFL